MSRTDIHRKPNIGMYQVVERLYKEKGYEIDLPNSVFVGDAAGRVQSKGRKKDHSNTDLQFALNVGIRFVTPEVGLTVPHYCPPVGADNRGTLLGRSSTVIP